MRDIKEVIHFYLGCEVKLKRRQPLKSWKTDILTCDILKAILGNIYDVKPILRKLPSMTDEEIDYVWNTEDTNNILAMEYSDGARIRKVSLTAERTIYLLSKHFDLFGLIESRLAIDKDTLTK